MNEIIDQISQVNKKKLAKWNKKERKTFLIFLRQYFPTIQSDFQVKNFNFDNSRTLLIDNRNYQIKLSIESIIELLAKTIFSQGSHDENSSSSFFVEDVFVMPNKKFFILKFKSTEFCKQVYQLNSRFQHFNLNFILVLDSLLEIVIEKYQAMVNQIVELFDEENQPLGLKIINDFIDESQELMFIEYTQNLFNLADSEKKVSRLKNREAIHLGYAFDYDQNTIVTDPKQVIKPEIPDVFDLLLNRFLEFIPEKPNQLTINRYNGSKGDHIPFHRDTHSMCTEWMVSLSLGSDVVMSWKNRTENQYALTILPTRSLMIMFDQARYLWNHGITKTTIDLVPMTKSFNDKFKTNRKRFSLRPRSERFSFTFRKTRPPCYRCQCDQCTKTVNENEIDPLKTSDPKELETNFVHETYDQIAHHFSTTRYKCWPQIVQFLKSLPPGSLVLDVGCGNGRFLSSNPSIVMIGTDRSINLLKICRQRNLETFMDDCLSVDRTIREQVFDAIISIAVIHHMATEKRRARAIHAILNLLTIYGRALIYVWAFEQKYAGASSKYLKPETQDTDQQSKYRTSAETPYPFIHQNRTEFRNQDLLVPWTKKKSNEESAKKFFRFYHVFHEGELENLIKNVGLMETRYRIQIERSYYDEGNWCVVVRKMNL